MLTDYFDPTARTMPSNRDLALAYARAGIPVVRNYCNETQQKAARAHRKWLSALDLQRLTVGRVGIHTLAEGALA
jgi:hypothetical protein